MVPFFLIWLTSVFWGKDKKPQHIHFMLYQRYNNETIVDVCDNKYSMLIIQWEKLLELIEK